MSGLVFSPDMIFSKFRLSFAFLYPLENITTKYMLHVRVYKSFQISHKLLYILSSERFFQGISKIVVNWIASRLIIISTDIMHEMLRLLFTDA